MDDVVKQEYHDDLVQKFICEVEPSDILHKPTGKLFNDFIRWCKNNDCIYRYQRPKFTNSVLRFTGYELKPVRIPKSQLKEHDVEIVRVFVPKG